MEINNILFATWIGLLLYIESRKVISESIIKVINAEETNTKAILKDKPNNGMLFIISLAILAFAVKTKMVAPYTLYIIYFAFGIIFLALSYKSYTKYKELYDNNEKEILLLQERKLDVCVKNVRFACLSILIYSIFKFIMLFNK